MQLIYLEGELSVLNLYLLLSTWKTYVSFELSQTLTSRLSKAPVPFQYL